MLSLGDMYVQDINNTLTISRGIEASDVIIVITEDGSVYSDSINTEHNVRSSFFLKSSMEVTSGDGSLEKPYVLGVAHEDKED